MIKNWIQNHKRIAATASAIIAFVLNFLTEKYFKIGIDFTNISNSSIIVMSYIALLFVCVYKGEKGEYEIVIFIIIIFLWIVMFTPAMFSSNANKKFESCIHQLSTERKESLSEITQTCAIIYKTKSTEN